MKHIFVSHAASDVAVANRLADDLRNAGHETRIDTRELTLGDDAIDFINDGVANAYTVIILYSIHTREARWQRLEINSAVWNEVAQDGGMCVVLRVDDTPLPPILGPKVYGRLDPANHAEYRRLLEELCRVILPRKSASSVVFDAFRAELKNPFGRLRAEFFEDRPDLHAETFAAPDALKMGALEEMKPCFLEGSRGTGKSMLLLSLRARNALTRAKASGVEKRGVFGFYLKLSRGALCNAGIPAVGTEPLGASAADQIQLTDIASQELVVCLLESLLSEVAFCIGQGLIQCERSIEKALAESLNALLFDGKGGRPESLDGVLETLGEIHLQIANFIRRKFIYGEHVVVPVAIFDLDMLKRVVRLSKRDIPALSGVAVTALLDEYENLFPFQQRIVNGLVKLAAPDVSVKVAKKLGTADTSGTTTGQELQETHDYTRVALVYDMDDVTQRSAYHELLRSITVNILRSQGLREVEIENLLPRDTTDEVDIEDVKREVARLSKVAPEEFDAWPPDRRAEKMAYYRDAAIYRVLYGGKGRRRDKRFCGFTELAFISSGVIRYFQEILGVAYHLTYEARASQTGGIVLPAEAQAKAAHLVSVHNLTTLSRNVENDGETLKYLVLDLGDCLRHKLLTHPSEPEAARLTIEDPERLERDEMMPLRKLLSVGVREAVFQTREGIPAFKPKHRSDPQPAEFNVCRIFAPVLQISPRLRWRTAVQCDVLLGLVTPGRRRTAIQELKREIVRTPTAKREDGQERIPGT